MEVDDMFGTGPEEEVVEEEVPTSATPDIGEASFFNSTPQSPAVPVHSGSPAAPISNSSSFSAYSFNADEDTSAFKNWKQQHDAELEEKSAKEQKAKEAARAAGRKELDQLLAEHAAKVEKNKKANASAEKELKAAQEGTEKSGESWEKVSAYMTAKVEREGQRDTTRYRDIVLKAKHA